MTSPPSPLWSGNDATAARWRAILRSYGHRVAVRAKLDDGERWDLLVALHARKSAAAVARFRERFPTRPVVVALTGTDLYPELDRAADTRASLDAADRIVVLHPLALERLDFRWRRKATAIYQSAQSSTRPSRPSRSLFEVCQVAHLRPVKDPLRTAMAVRGLPAGSRIRVLLVGGALHSGLGERARRETSLNPRFRWVGSLSPAHTLRLLASSRLAVVTSKHEGGCNALSEALASGIPVLATRIDACVALLGDDYPGLFEVGDTRQLRALLLRAEADPGFYRSLAQACARRAALVTPQREREAWARLLAGLAAPR